MVSFAKPASAAALAETPGRFDLSQRAGISLGKQRSSGQALGHSPGNLIKPESLWKNLVQSTWAGLGREKHGLSRFQFKNA